MRADHLQGWITSAKQEWDPKTANWERVVDLVKTFFRDGILTTKCTWKMVVLLPTWNFDYRGVGIIEVFRKTMSEMMNHRIEAVVRFHGALHEFRAERGTGTASLEVKLLQP